LPKKRWRSLEIYQKLWKLEKERVWWASEITPMLLFILESTVKTMEILPYNHHPQFKVWICFSWGLLETRWVCYIRTQYRYKDSYFFCWRFW
jgi:hypothetical protein